jgi:HEAT repeat protein
MLPGDYLQQMIAQHGADRVVTIRIDGLNGDVREFLLERLKSASGAGNFFTTGSGDSLTVHLAPVSDVQSLADKIDFGEVKQVDAARRTIDVRADPAKLPKPLKPEVNDPQDPAFYARNLEDLSSWDKARRHAAVVHLRDAPPARDRSRIAAALVVRLKDDSDRAVRTEAAAALATWGTADTVPALVAALKDADPFVKRKAMETVAKRKDPSAAGPLAACLKTERHHAAECLKRYGPGAEEAVLPYLDDDDGWVRLEAAKVLQEIGTAHSLPALRQAASGHDGLLPGAAKQAVNAIEQRADTPSEP